MVGLAERLGTICPGLATDLVVLGNPTQDIAGLERVRLVIKGGELVRE